MNNAMPTKDGWVRTVRCRFCGAERRYDIPYCPICEGATGGTLPANGYIEAYECSGVKRKCIRVKVIQEYYG